MQFVKRIVIVMLIVITTLLAFGVVLAAPVGLWWGYDVWQDQDAQSALNRIRRCLRVKVMRIAVDRRAQHLLQDRTSGCEEFGIGRTARQSM